MASSSAPGGRLAVEVPLHEGVVPDHDPFDQLLAHLVLGGGEVVGNGPALGLAAFVDDGGVGEEVGDPPEAGLLTHGELEGGDPGSEAVAQRAQGAVEAGPLPVELVDEHQSGQAHLGGQIPGGLGLGFDALDGAHDHDGQVHHRGGRPDLAEEVGVARGVDDVQLDVAEQARGQGEGERHVPLDLLGLEVAHRGPVVDLALSGDGAGGEEERLGQRGLARAVVSDQGDIADAGRWVRSAPRAPPSLEILPAWPLRLAAYR